MDYINLDEDTIKQNIIYRTNKNLHNYLIFSIIIKIFIVSFLLGSLSFFLYIYIHYSHKIYNILHSIDTLVNSTIPNELIYLHSIIAKHNNTISTFENILNDYLNNINNIITNTTTNNIINIINNLSTITTQLNITMIQNNLNIIANDLQKIIH